MSKSKDMWDEIKVIVATVEMDMAKHVRENVAAGIRARSGLRLLRDKVSELIKQTLQENKQTYKDRHTPENPEKEKDK